MLTELTDGSRERKQLLAFDLGVLLKAPVTLPMFRFTDTTCVSSVAVTLFTPTLLSYSSLFRRDSVTTEQSTVKGRLIC